MTYGQNVVRNPSADTTDLSPYGGGNATFARTTDQSHSGVSSFAVTATAAGTYDLYTEPLLIGGGQKFKASFSVFAKTVARKVYVECIFYDITGAQLTAIYPSGNDVVGVWTDFATGAVMSDSKAYSMRLFAVVEAAAAGEVVYVDDFSVQIDDAVVQSASDFYTSNDYTNSTNRVPTATLTNRPHVGSLLILLRWAGAIPAALSGWTTRASDNVDGLQWRLEERVSAGNEQVQTGPGGGGGVVLIELAAGYVFDGAWTDNAGNTARGSQGVTIYPHDTESLLIGFLTSYPNTNDSPGDTVNSWTPFGGAAIDQYAIYTVGTTTRYSSYPHVRVGLLSDGMPPNAPSPSSLTVNVQPFASFESNAPLWSGASATTSFDSAHVYTGTRALRMVGTAASFYSNQPNTYSVPVVPGQQYTHSLYVYTTAAGVTARLNIGFQRAGNGYVSNVNGATVGLMQNGWTRLTVTGMVPGGTGIVYQFLGVQVMAGGNGASIWCDAAQVESGPSATAWVPGPDNAYVDRITPTSSQVVWGVSEALRSLTAACYQRPRSMRAAIGWGPAA